MLIKLTYNKTKRIYSANTRIREKYNKNSPPLNTIRKSGEKL